MPVMSEGIRSGVNWTRLKERLSTSARVEMSSVLARPGTPDEEAVAAGEEGDQEVLDHLALPDDALLDLLDDGGPRPGERLHGAEIGTGLDASGGTRSWGRS